MISYLVTTLCENLKIKDFWLALISLFSFIFRVCPKSKNLVKNGIKHGIQILGIVSIICLACLVVSSSGQIIHIMIQRRRMRNVRIHGRTNNERAVLQLQLIIGWLVCNWDTIIRVVATARDFFHFFQI